MGTCPRGQLIGLLAILLGCSLASSGWNFYQRKDWRFWVSRPFWYFLYPSGTVLSKPGFG